jgi:WD40 repeat protein/serine/threonine protein kinase
MTTWDPRANELFLKALDLRADGARQEYLDAACAGDAALRAEVEALLEASARAEGFLESPVRARPGIVTVHDPPVSERPGTMIGPYKLLEQIGEGGFGVVFMAEQSQPVRRKVALKVLKAGMDTRQVVARFEAERQALALMDHPNIAHVFDGGETASGRPYFVMELIRGVPITGFCDQTHLPVRERLGLFVNVCQAVQHAHQKGIIHRDLKPTNVLVTLHDDKAVVKVIDFGVAKALGQELTDKTLFTGFAQMVGTPLYMSPEQAQMSGLDVDTRSDVYSLGVLLYELLTGTTPCDRQRFRTAGYDEIRRIIREEEPPKPSTRISTLGQAAATVSANRRSDPKRLGQLFRGELDWIVMKALEKDRNRRYESASAFAADVQRYLDDEPVQACPPSRWYRFRRLARRHKAVLAAVSVVVGAVVLAIISLVGAVTVLAASNAEVQAEQQQTKKALTGEKAANENLRQAMAREERVRSFQLLALAERELAAKNIGRGEELLTECPASLRGWEWHLLKRLAQEPPRVMSVGKVWILDLACSPDGRYLATSGFGGFFEGEVKLREADTGKEVHTLRGHLGPATGLAFRPQADQLATAGLDGMVVLWDVATAKPMRTLRGHGGPVIFLSYRPDGKRLASASLDGTVRVWEVSTGAELLRFRGHGDAVPCVAYSPDGQRLASWGMDFHVRVWDAATGRQQQRLAGHHGRVFSLLWHKDGRHFVSAGADGLRVWDLQTGQEERAFKGINSASLRAVFSPDGQRLVSAGWDRTVQILDWRSGQEILALRAHTDLVTALAFSPDGQRLFTAGMDGTLRVWDATPLAEKSPHGCRRFAGHQGQVLGLAFSPDQRYLATASMDGTAKVWAVASGKLVHTLAGHDAMVTSVAFHAGGKRLTTVTVSGTLVQWDPATGERRQTLQDHLGPVLNVGFNAGFSADGERLTTVGKDGAVRVWDTESGREIPGGRPALLHPLAASLSPDGERLAISSLGSVQLQEVTSRKRLASWPTGFHILHNLAFSRDGRRLATASWDGSVKVWDIKSARLLHTFRHGEKATCAAFHPNGRQLASGSCDNTAKIWDLDTGREVATLPGHIGYVMTLAYSPDGRLLATASGNRYRGEVQLWDTASFGKQR